MDTFAKEMEHYNEQRLKSLQELSARLQSLTATLRALKQDPFRKWTWSLEAMCIVRQLREIASQNLPFIRSRIDKAMQFPSAELADPTRFLGGRPGHKEFHRTPNWFEEMGFILCRTPYTFADTWDCSNIYANILIPKTLDGTCAKIIFYFHGGGFCTGGGNFVSWYSKASLELAKDNNAIIIAPDYPLGPEATYLEISNAIKAFLVWYHERGCFENKSQGLYWTDWITHTTGISLHGFDPTTTKILIEGESAGGHAAVTAMFANGETERDLLNPWACGLPISAVFLRYPMLKHYERDCPDTVSYMNMTFSKEQINWHVAELQDAVSELETLSLIPTRSNSHPPQHMSAAFLLSVTKTWQIAFQRFEYQGYPFDASMDALERVTAYSQAPYLIKDRAKLPPIIIYHGNQDPNCPIADTLEFCNLLKSSFPDQYIDSETLFFDKVTKLEAQPRWIPSMMQLEDVSVSGVGHGFDYDLDWTKEPFMQYAFYNITKFW
ncbi:hypothetical protein J1614_010763 [Plenodomus biglobosus]|nr:hypothetical protein J1614_010763 [Plenodomus biglobosus]